MEKSRNIENQKRIERGEAEIDTPEKGDSAKGVREPQKINNDHLQNSFYNFSVNPAFDNLNRHSKTN